MCLYSTSARIFCACCNRLFNCFLMPVLRCDEVRKSPNSGHLCERKQNDQSSQTCGTSFTKTYRCKLLCYCSCSVTCLTGKALQLLKKVRVWRFRENKSLFKGICQMDMFGIVSATCLQVLPPGVQLNLVPSEQRCSMLWRLFFLYTETFILFTFPLQSCENILLNCKLNLYGLLIVCVAFFLICAVFTEGF